jgi:hypothetical protein
VSSVLVSTPIALPRIQLRRDAHSNVRGYDSTLVTQSTGQTSVLHGLAVTVSGHRPALPIVGRSTLRVRDAVPPAHVAEQVAQLDQAPTMQSSACIEGEPDGTVVGGSVGVGVVELGVGNRVGEGVGADVGVGVGLHTETVCSMMPASKSWIFVAGHVRTPLCQSQRPNADGRQS